MKDILFKTEEYIFSYRVGGVLIHNGNILLQKVPEDDGYAFPGGHVSFGETSDITLLREFKEEMHADIKIEKLLMYGENFFTWANKPCQQICVYYLVSLSDSSQIPLEGTFKAFDEKGFARDDLDFCWIPLSELSEKILYPVETKPYVLSLPESIVSFIHKNN